MAIVAKAAVFVNVGQPFEVKEFSLAGPEKGLALVRMLASGICGTDIHIIEGKIGLPMLPMVIGHEFIGEIVAVNAQDSASGFRAGDRVIVTVAKTCHECSMCNTGESATCHNLSVTYFHAPDKPPHLFGGYADHTYAPLGCMTKIPAEIPSKTAAIFACAGPTVFNAVRCGGVEGFKNVHTLVVQGLGPVGLFSVLYAKACGVKNIVAVSTGRNPKRQDLARTLGATHFLSTADSSCEDRVKQVTAISGGFGADCVIEASGNPDAFNEGMDMLRSRGVYLVPGLYSNRGDIRIKPQLITFKALQIFGSAQYSSDDQAKYIDFLRAHRDCWAAIDSVCTHEWKIADINKAIDACMKGESVKAIFVS